MGPRPKRVFAVAKDRVSRVEAVAAFARSGGGLRRTPPRARRACEIDKRIAP